MQATMTRCRSSISMLPFVVAQLIILLLWLSEASAASRTIKLDWKIEYANVTRLCHTKSAVTVNGLFPGPTVKVTEGDTVIIKVTNLVSDNVTIHWHGVKQILSAWADGPAYITQCPITTGTTYTYKFKIVEQRGTLFWHAHISWLRSTLYGAFIIQPKKPNFSPYVPHNVVDKIILLGEWWNANTEDVIAQAILNGGRYNASDAYTINGQLGALYNCSLEGTAELVVQHGRTYLLRIINAALNAQFYFSVANHTLTVVEHDAEYLQPFTTDVILLSSGQTMNVLLTADQKPKQTYAIAASLYQPQSRIRVANFAPATALLRYKHASNISAAALNTSALPLPAFPAYTNATFEYEFVGRLRSLVAGGVPLSLDENLLFTVGYAFQNCSDCLRSPRMGTAISNHGFLHPTSRSILEAFYYNVSGVYEPDFPDVPPVQYNYTTNNNDTAVLATKAKVLKYGSKVQVVLQDTGTLFFESHPMHLHGQNFYIVGSGVGTYNSSVDPASFNLVDPPSVNTVSVPFGGWIAIRFQALNPGVWFLHCHIEIHVSLGMAMVFITQNGNQTNQILGPPPSDLPRC